VAAYKVPQDVEAEDKLIGPLSFRQFIYMMVAGGAAFVAFLLYQISPFLVIIPLPIVFSFGILALPLRKDQPMEVYLLAVIRFWLKPHRRIWDPDGTISFVEITAPRLEQRPLTGTLTPESAEQRLDYLTRIMDTRGWSLKRMDGTAEASVAPKVVDEAARATDVMDDHADLAKSFDDLLAKKNQQNRQEAIKTMHGPQANGSILEQQFAKPAPKTGEPDATPHFNPYPTIHQKVIQPYHEGDEEEPTQKPAEAEQKPPAAPVPAQVSPAIMRLASNNDLSISALANEAHRLQEGDEGEVVISLH
jgi:hypothetical protein